MLGGFHAPRFGEMGCLGAIIAVVLIVAGVLALLYVPWSLVMWE